LIDFLRDSKNVEYALFVLQACHCSFSREDAALVLNSLSAIPGHHLLDLAGDAISAIPGVLADRHWQWALDVVQSTFSVCQAEVSAFIGKIRGHLSAAQRVQLLSLLTFLPSVTFEAVQIILLLYRTLKRDDPMTDALSTIWTCLFPTPSSL
jgi:hypothetical protein